MDAPSSVTPAAAVALQQLAQVEVGLASADCRSTAGKTPQQVLRYCQFEKRTPVENALWLEVARLNSIVGSSWGTLPSVRSGIKCYIAFIDAVIGKVKKYFPPELGWLQAWAVVFRCHLTFANYLGYVKTACLFVKADVSVFGHAGIGRAKVSIMKAGNFTPRPKMWIRRPTVAAMLKWSHEHAQFVSCAKLFLMAYCFLSRLPSEALPVVAGRGEPLDAHAVLWKTNTELVLDLRIRKNTNGPRRMTRSCL